MAQQQQSSAQRATRARRRSTACSPPRARARRARLRLAGGRPAERSTPRLNGNLPTFVPNDEALASGADVIFLCLGNERGGGVRAAGRAPSSSTSPARTGSRTPRSTRSWYGFEHPRRRRRREWSYGAAGASAADGRADREPRLLRDRGAARARAARATSSTGDVVVDAKSGMTGAGRDAQGALARRRRARELLAVRGRRAPARARDRRRCSASRSCFVPHLLPDPARPARDLLRRRRRRRDAARAARGGVRRQRRSCACCPRASRRRSARVQGTDAAEIGVFADARDRPHDRDLRAEDNLGKGAAGQAVQNANLALGLERDRSGLAARRRRDGAGNVSVTAAKGFVASGVPRGIRRRRPRPRDRPLAARPPSARRCSRATACRRPACSSTAEHLALAEPQAVVINSGVANAATGRARASSTRSRPRPRRRGCSTSTPEEVLVLSTGVIGEPAAAAQAAARRSSRRAARSRPAGGADAAEAIMTTDTRPKDAVARGDGFTVGGMAKGSGMIHPDLATMLAVVTTDYPLEPGEAIEFLRPAVEETLQRDLGRRRAARRTTRDPARERRERRRADAGRPTTRSRRRCSEVCADLARQVVADGEGVTVLAEINVTGAADDAAGEGDRAADRHLAARQDGALRPRRELGPRADGRRLRAVQRRLRAQHRRRTASRSATTARSSSTAARRPTSSRTSPAPSCTIELDLGLGDGAARYLTSDLSYDYVRINADYRT